jgi:hypothetical protein
LAAYYRFGIPVMITRKRLVLGAINPAALDAETFAPGKLAKSLGEVFKATPNYPSIQFKALATRKKAHVDIALHESLFEPRTGFRYLPVTHSLARLRLDKGEVTVTGYVNWYVLFVLVYLVLNTLLDQSFIFIAIIVVIIFGVSLFFQKTVAGLVTERINSILGQE